MSTVESLLIANRGEIAVRVIRAARELGLRTIAVYSELDRDSLHVELADEAWNIGPPPAAESYLDIDRIMNAAQSAGAAAVHPGYGFLAENAEFANAVTNAGLIWVGPPSEAIRIMGDKTSSRLTAAKAGVPGVPGTFEPAEGLSEIENFAKEHGYPLAIKAAHGGGGRGLKVVTSAGDLAASYESARREAEAWFGRSEVYIERYLEKSRHIEAQVIFDLHGNGVFLGERDCSIQRRHQKLIEEAPAPGLSPKQRKEIGKRAIAVAASADYVSAGTVEFLVDSSGEPYFLEMNTRIQVEHTITEMVTGIDLVKTQLRIAMGEPLPFKSVETHGHAIEFRINVEDPTADFAPTPGTLVEYQEPGGFGVRVDSGVTVGSTISQYYDNLIAKLVVWGTNREEAMARGIRALSDFHVAGVPTTIPAHLSILSTEAFRQGTHDTRFVEDQMCFGDADPTSHPTLPEQEEIQERSMTVEVGGKRFVVRFWAPVTESPEMSGSGPVPRRRPPKLERSTTSGHDTGVITAPMQGTIVKTYVPAGTHLKIGDPICVLEAMKMENEIKSPIEGELIDLRIQPGDTVATGSVLAIIR